MEREKRRGDGNGWRLNECDWESNAGKEKETVWWQKRLKNWKERWREGGRGREVNMERLSLQLVSICPSTAGRVCLAPFIWMAW